MKKLLSVLLCLALLAAMVPASAVTYYDTLAEKFSYQLAKGSGLAGALQLTVTGEGDWAKQLRPLSGKQWQLQGIRTTAGQFSYELYLADGEEKSAVTTLTGNNEQAWLQSDLLIDTLLTLPLHSDLTTTLTSMDAETNVSWYSALRALMDITPKEWEAVLPDYEQLLESWSMAYAGTPVLLTGDEMTLLISYDIPGEAIREEMKVLLAQALADEQLLALLGSCMTEEQQAAYLNPELLWYYEGIVDALPLSENVLLEREMTTNGEVLSTDMSFPVAFDGWTALTVHLDPETNSLTLKSDISQLAFSWSKTEGEGKTSWSGALAMVSDEQTVVDVSYTVACEESAYTDEENRSHELQDWTLTLTDRGSATAFEPVAARLRLHWYSKALNDQATTLEITAAAELPGGTASLAAKLRTTTPFEPTAAPEGTAVDLSTLSAERRTEYLSDIFANALAVLTATEEEPEAEASDEPEATAEPEQAPAEEAPDELTVEEAQPTAE